MRVFVYGTLRNGASNPCSNYGGKYVGTGVLSGAQLFDLGAYPGLKFTDDALHQVVGDVFEVDESIMTRLDRYEGYRPTDPFNSLYMKRQAEVPGFGTCYVYEYNSEPRGHRPVPNGDWMQTHA